MVSIHEMIPGLNLIDDSFFSTFCINHSLAFMNGDKSFGARFVY